jgi:hypothetical protein
MDHPNLDAIYLTRRFAESFDNGQSFPQFIVVIGALRALVESLLLEVDAETCRAVMASMEREIERNRNRRA